MTAGAAIYKVLDDGRFGKDYIIQDFNKAALKAEGKAKKQTYWGKVCMIFDRILTTMD